MEIPAWNDYISTTLSLTPHDFSIVKLEGGIINSTVRLTLNTPISTVPGSGRTWDPPLKSCVMKHAPPHMPFHPDQPLTLFRQTIEARALEFCHAHGEILGDGEMEVPELIWLDKENAVLWMTDLGPMMTLTEYMNGQPFSPIATKGEAAVAHEIGHRIGAALGRLHAGTLRPSVEEMKKWTDPDQDRKPKEEKEREVGDHLRVLSKQLMIDYADLSPDDAEELSTRIGMGEYLHYPGEEDQRALSLGDFWPGCVLLSADDRQQKEQEEGGMKLAMVDFEFFNAYHPARDLAMLLGHFRTHELEAIYPSDAPLACKQPKELIMGRTEGAGKALWEAYQPLMAHVAKTNRWTREALCSWGREMIVVGGDFRKDIITEEGMRACIAEGVKCLRAAGKDPNTMEMKWVEDAPEMLRMLL